MIWLLCFSKALFSVTDLVVDALRVADTSIARITGNILQGVKAGSTEIQVLAYAPLEVSVLYTIPL